MDGNGEDPDSEELNDRMDAGECADARETMSDSTAENTATASPSDEEQLVTMLDGDEAKRAFEELSTEPKYEQLEKRVAKRGEQLRPGETTVIRVDGERKALIADVPIVETDAEEAHLSIGRDEETGEVLGATLEYDERIDDGTAIVKTTLDATEGSSFEKTTQRLDSDTFRDLMDGM